MGQKIIRILAKPLYPYLYGVAFLIFKSSAQFRTFRLLDSAGALTIYIFMTFLFLQGMKKFTDSATAAVLSILLWASLFHVVGVAKLFHYPYAFIPLSFYIYFYGGVMSAFFIIYRFPSWFSWIQSHTTNRLINVYLIISTLVFFLAGLKKNQETTFETIEHSYSANAPILLPQKDIVWILMDEYGSSGALREQFDFFNPLDTFLERKEFIVLKTMHSRENITLFSVNSIFNLDDSIRPSSYYEGISLLNQGALVPLLEQNGYSFVNLSFFNISKHPMLADRSGYPNTFLQQLISGTLIGMFYQERKYRIAKCDQYSKTVLQILNDTLSQKSKQPRFIWAHLPIPHEPFCRDSLGKLQKDLAIGATDTILMKQKYIEYLEYGNSVIISLIKDHPELSDKVVIISGDHGPRFPCLTQKEYQKWPFVAIHFPKPYDTTGLHKLEYISQLPGFLMRLAVGHTLAADRKIVR